MKLVFKKIETIQEQVSEKDQASSRELKFELNVERADVQIVINKLLEEANVSNLGSDDIITINIDGNDTRVSKKTANKILAKIYTNENINNKYKDPQLISL